MVYIVFIATATMLFGYLVLASRKIDIFLVSGFSAILFSTPLFFGRVSGPRNYPDMPIEVEIYLTFILLFSILLIVTIINDCRHKTDHHNNHSETEDKKFNKNIVGVFFVIWFLILLVILSKIGIGLFYGVSKRMIIDSLGFELILLSCIAVITSTGLIIFYNGIGKLLGVAILLIMLVSGDRTSVAITGIAVLLFIGQRLPRLSLLFKYPFLAPFSLLTAIMSLALTKSLYSVFKNSGIRYLFEYITSENLFSLMSKGAEFTHTQYQYNTIVYYTFTTDGMHILRGPLSFLPLPRSWYTTPSSEFNDIFQTALFPDVISGMAYNPFAEFYSAAGFKGVVIYIFIFVMSCLFLNRLIMYSRTTMTLMYIVIAGFVAFYSFRNSIAVSFGLIRNIFWPYLFVWFSLILQQKITLGHENWKVKNNS